LPPPRAAVAAPGGTAPAADAGRERKGGRTTLDGTKARASGRTTRTCPTPRGERPATAANAGRRTNAKLGEHTLMELLGSLEQIPWLAIDASKLRSLDADHVTGFVLSQVDGEVTLETIIDLSGMPRLDALRILHRLVEQGTLTLHSSDRRRCGLPTKCRR